MNLINRARPQSELAFEYYMQLAAHELNSERPQSELAFE